MTYVVRRLGFYLVALWVALTINFVLPRMMPGNPAQLLMANFQGRLSPRAMHSLEVAFGLNLHQSLPAQYLLYLGQLLHGDFGTSLTYFPTSVGQVIATSLPWTLGLVGLSTVVSFSIGVGVGILSAWRRGSRLDATLPPLATFLSAFPYFWLALAFLYVFGFLLGWLPLSGAYTASMTPALSLAFVGDVVRHGILPALTIVITSVGGWLVTMRNTMIATLAEDYVVMAQAKGLPERRVMVHYAARNAILPNITGFAMSLGFVVGGAIVTEIVFSYPGVGFQLLQAVQREDYPLMQAIFLLISCAVLGANLLADILYSVLDPRVRQRAAA